MKIVVFIFALMVAWGCGKEVNLIEGVPKGFTKIKFSGSENKVASLTGGMIIYAINADNLSQIVSENFTDEESLTSNENLVTLPNGNWKFFGYGGTTSACQQKSDVNCKTSIIVTSYCSIANSGNSLVLDGGTKTVSLVFSTELCNDSIFASSELSPRGVKSLESFTVNLCTDSDFSNYCLGGSCSCSSSLPSLLTDSFSGTYYLITAMTTLPLSSYTGTSNTNSLTAILGDSITSIKNCSTVTSSICGRLHNGSLGCVGIDSASTGTIIPGNVGDLGGKSPFSLYMALISVDSKNEIFDCDTIANSSPTIHKEVELVFGLDYLRANPTSRSNDITFYNSSIYLNTSL